MAVSSEDPSGVWEKDPHRSRGGAGRRNGCSSCLQILHLLYPETRVTQEDGDFALFFSSNGN